MDRFHLQRISQCSNDLAGVRPSSIHYLFRSADHLARAIADPSLVATLRELFSDTVKDAHLLAPLTLGLRDLYGKQEIHSITDVKRLQIRVQARRTAI
jgi:TRAP-type C4-dicarboxylate transport system substrate-binding protein